MTAVLGGTKQQVSATCDLQQQQHMCTLPDSGGVARSTIWIMKIKYLKQQHASSVFHIQFL